MVWQTGKINIDDAEENETHFMQTKIKMNGVKRVDMDLMREEVKFSFQKILKIDI